MDKRNVKVVLLVGGRDFGRCPIASETAPALWPVMGEPALQRVLKHLAGQNVAEAVICSDDDISVLRRSISIPCGIVVRFISEELPMGTAGCIRLAAGGDRKSLWVVMRAAMTQPPDIAALISAHDHGQTDLTLMLKSPDELTAGKELADIYIMEPSAIKHIPEEGYCDIKEGLIPALVQAGGTIRTAQLSHSIGAFGERNEYLAAVGQYLCSSYAGHIKAPVTVGNDSCWLSMGNAKIDSSARMYGPVMIMNDVTVQAGAIIFGPAVLERGVTIGRDSFVENSVLWPGASIGAHCEIRNCIVGHKTSVPADSVLADTGTIDAESVRKSRVEPLKPKAGKTSRSKKRQPLQQDSEILPVNVPRHILLGMPLMLSAGFGLLFMGLIAVYWPVLADVWRVWLSSPEYSEGIAVPFLAMYVLWSRREKIRRCFVKPSVGWGIAGFAAASAVMVYGIIYNNVTAQQISFIMALASIVLFLFGRRLFVRVSSVMLFALLMFPLPQSVHNFVLAPIQRFSVSSAEFCLQCLGIYASSTGNTLNVDRVFLNVGPGCSGLRMVGAFFIVSAMIALLIRRSIWEKMLVLVSSIPIAILCNTLRITLAGAGIRMFAENIEWQNLLHTAGGYAMIPVAMIGLMGELWLISKLLPVKTEQPAVNSVSIKWEST